MRRDRRERHSGRVVDGDSDADQAHGQTRAALLPLGSERVQRHEGEPSQQEHQAAEHVQLGVQVDDHVAGLAAPVESLVHERHRLHRALQRPDRQRRAAREHERPQRALAPPDRPDDRHEQQPERREHRDPGAHDQERVERRGLLGLLRREAVVDDEPALVEPEVEGREVEGERAAEERVEDGVQPPTRGLHPARGADQREERAGDEHRQAGDEVDVRVADRVDPLAGMPRLVEPVRVRRLHLDHALDGADRQGRGARREELPQVPLRLRHADEARLEDRHADVGREAPVAEAHHPGAHPGRRLVPVAHVRLRGGIAPAVLDQRAHRDPVADQRDVEDRQADDREPERALGEALARKRPADHARQRQPAEPGGEQRAAADDHHVRVREVAHEVARVARTREVLGDPGQVLQHHVQASEHEEEAAGEEVLRGLAVVRVELLVRVRLVAGRRRAAGHEPEHRREQDGKNETYVRNCSEVTCLTYTSRADYRRPGSRK